METCPNCSAKISKGMFNSNELVSEQLVQFVNEFRDDKKDGYCQKCFSGEQAKVQPKYEAEKKEIEGRMLSTMDSVPIVSSHAPADWQYETIGIVTAQSVMGTGFFTEISSAISDFTGSQSQAIGDKIRVGERNCYKQIRREALRLGGNAILALDIDYNEMGGLKGMVMVCMTGTAVILNNEKLKTTIDEYKKDGQRLGYLRRIGLALSLS